MIYFLKCLLGGMILYLVFVTFGPWTFSQDTEKPCNLEDAETDPEGTLRTRQERHYNEMLKILEFCRAIHASVKSLEKTAEINSVEMQNMKEKIESCSLSAPTHADDRGRISTNDQTLLPKKLTKADDSFLTKPGKCWMENLLRNSRARLFSGENQTGKAEDYIYENSNMGSCHQLADLEFHVRSVETFGTCVRLFSGYSCLGWSVAVYPGSGSAGKVLNNVLKYVSSIGPCLPEEFQHATFYDDSVKQTARKNSPDVKTYFPDEVEFYNSEKWNTATSLSSPNHCIDKFALGPGKRVEFLRAVISQKHLQANVSPQNSKMEESQFFDSLDKEEGDVVGYGIPLELGGTAEQNYNVFPQSEAGREEWARITLGVRECLETQFFDEVYLAVNFAYENNGKTRPSSFFYWMRCDHKTFQKVSYGRVAN